VSEIQNKKRLYRGKVISDKMDKTVVVEFERTYKHPDTKKIMKTAKKYKVHDEKQLAKVGDVVEFYEGRPVSKTKYMYLSHVIA
jgi:small subunit ribosomal protein S17